MKEEEKDLLVELAADADENFSLEELAAQADGSVSLEELAANPGCGYPVRAVSDSFGPGELKPKK